MENTLKYFRHRSLCPESILNRLLQGWVVIALLGQWMFALYIFILYALPTVVGVPEVTHQFLPGNGIKDKNPFDAIVFFTHILPAVLMTSSGLLQFIPSVRNRYPRFHKYNGRMFFILGISGAITGLYLTWVTGLRFSDIGSLGITLNGILIPIFIFYAWRTAINKQFKAHQRLAIHSFLLVNGVWTFRLYLMGWYTINQGPNGNSGNVDGPADIAISFACYLLPMAIAELVFWAKGTKTQWRKWLVSVVLGAGVLITFIGVFSAILMMWIPEITGVVNALF